MTLREFHSFFNLYGSIPPQLAADLKRGSSAFSLRMTFPWHDESFGNARASRTGSAKGKHLPSDTPQAFSGVVH